ncbi:hypothetical protein Pla175_48300 [Pirellulimonas nuda]|uniref:Tetratricopeptide repeat protein n=2 Tax=Pirellulimonas nuda TaxID=2528009 RepID=A0A518DIU9_9BACT|nr:hypothetical protein Pla175_48300 [Pirellulimonas nuda]
MIVTAGWLRPAGTVEPPSDPQGSFTPVAELALPAPSYVDAYPQAASRQGLLANPFASSVAEPPPTKPAPAEPPSAERAELAEVTLPHAGASEFRFAPPRLTLRTPEPAPPVLAPEAVTEDAPAWIAEDEASFAMRVSTAEALAYTPVSRELSRSLAPKVQQGFQLGKSGALFAAREKFLGVLRKIASAKDAAEQTTRHSTALEEGLLALEESEDFATARAVGGGPVDVSQVAQSHHTPLLEALDPAARSATLPHEAAAMYHRYGEAKLGGAVAGEQAGSMALYGLGKTYARLAEREGQPAAAAQSLSYFRAATIAHAGNYMAANEVGVHLARSGHYDESYRALAAAVPHNPDSNIFRNLAVVERSLGRPEQALAAQARADQLAAAEKSTGEFARSRGVQWVDPAQFQATTPSSPGPGSPEGAAAMAQQSPAAPARPAGSPGPIRSALGWGDGAPAGPSTIVR